MGAGGTRLCAGRELRSDHASAYFGLGIAYAQQGQHEAAKDAWKQTLLLDPDHAEARHNLGFLWACPESAQRKICPRRTYHERQRTMPRRISSSPLLLLLPIIIYVHDARQVEYEGETSQINSCCPGLISCRTLLCLINNGAFFFFRKVSRKRNSGRGKQDQIAAS